MTAKPFTIIYTTQDSPLSVHHQGPHLGIHQLTSIQKCTKNRIQENFLRGVWTFKIILTSLNHFEPLWIILNFWIILTCWTFLYFDLFWIIWNFFESFESFWTFLNVFESFWTFLNHIELLNFLILWFIWNFFESCRTFWTFLNNHFEPFESFWTVELFDTLIHFEPSLDSLNFWI